MVRQSLVAVQLLRWPSCWRSRLPNSEMNRSIDIEREVEYVAGVMRTAFAARSANKTEDYVLVAQT